MSESQQADTYEANLGHLALFVDGARVWANDVIDTLEAVIERAEQVDGWVYHDWQQSDANSETTRARLDENTADWAAFCEQHGLTQVDAPQINPTGIRIALDAIERRDEVEALCVLSAAHQLGALCDRFRAAGVYVVGLSNWRSADEFRAACDEFAVVDDRQMSQARRQAEQRRDEDADWDLRLTDLCQTLGNPWTPVPVIEGCLTEVYPEFDLYDEGADSLEEWFRERPERFQVQSWRGGTTTRVRARREQERRTPPPSRSRERPQPGQPWEPMAIEALQREPRDAEGWIQLPQLGQRLRDMDPDWSPKRYGADKLLNLLDQRENLFEIEEEMDDEERFVRRHWVRLAPDADLSQTPPPPPRPAAPDIPAPAAQPAPPAEPPQPWHSLVAEALQEAPEDEDGWLELSELEQRLRSADADWSPQRYGADDLVDLLDQRQDLFEIEEEMDDEEREVLTHWIRLAEPEDF